MGTEHTPGEAAIRRLLAAQLLSIGTDDEDAYVGGFAVDGENHLPFGVFRGHDELRHAFRTFIRPLAAGVREVGVNHVITITGDRATSVMPTMILRVAGDAPDLLATTIVRDELRLVAPDTWRIVRRHTDVDSTFDPSRGTVLDRIGALTARVERLEAELAAVRAAAAT